MYVNIVTRIQMNITYDGHFTFWHTYIMMSVK